MKYSTVWARTELYVQGRVLFARPRQQLGLHAHAAGAGVGGDEREEEPRGLGARAEGVEGDADFGQETGDHGGGGDEAGSARGWSWGWTVASIRRDSLSQASESTHGCAAATRRRKTTEQLTPTLPWTLPSSRAKKSVRAFRSGAVGSNGQLEPLRLRHSHLAISQTCRMQPWRHYPRQRRRSRRACPR